MIIPLSMNKNKHVTGMKMIYPSRAGKKCLFCEKLANIPTICYLFLCTKGQNFPPSSIILLQLQHFRESSFPNTPFGKSILQVPDTGTRVLDNTRPLLLSSIVSFWITPACSKERKCHIFRQYWYNKNVPVFTNTGMYQYLGPEVYFSPPFYLTMYPGNMISCYCGPTLGSSFQNRSVCV